MKTFATLIAFSIIAATPSFADGKLRNVPPVQQQARATDDWGPDEKGGSDVKGGEDVKGADDGRTQRSERTQRTQRDYPYFPSSRTQRESREEYPVRRERAPAPGYDDRGGYEDRRVGPGPRATGLDFEDDVGPGRRYYPNIELCEGRYSGSYADGTPVNFELRPGRIGNQVYVTVIVGRAPIEAIGECATNGGIAKLRFSVDVPNKIQHEAIISLVNGGPIIKGTQILLGIGGGVAGLPFELRAN